MESLWKKQMVQLKGSHTLNQDQFQDEHREVIVIGAGMAGLLIAYYLQEAGRQVLVLEADKIASGQTGNTTAKITSQHGLKYSSLMYTIGRKKAELYAKANEQAIREYERLIREKKIECGFKRLPAYLYSTESEELLKREARAAALLGIDAFFTKETELPFPVAGAVGFRGQAQFSPLEFIRSIAAELEIWEGKRVTAIRGNKVVIGKQVMSANQIIVATHYPIKDFPGFFFGRQHQERSYVLALSGCERIEGMYYGIESDGLSLRQAGDYLLLGGGSHRTGDHKKEGGYEFLVRAAEKYFPKGNEDARWSAQDCMPHDGIPFIGRYSVFTPNLYVATGFQKWGMTSSMIAALLLKDELAGKDNPYKSVFSPQRFHFFAGEGKQIVDTGISIKGLMSGRINKEAPRCPHMGCKLVFNPHERSWDCPCHGSRFDLEGRLVDNPANTGIKKGCRCNKKEAGE